MQLFCNAADFGKGRGCCRKKFQLLLVTEALQMVAEMGYTVCVQKVQEKSQ